MTGCPLLTITSNVKCASPVCLDIAVSIVHECTTCQFGELNPPQCIEKESISNTDTRSNLSYILIHDWSNKFSLHLIFIICINNHTFILLVSLYITYH